MFDYRKENNQETRQQTFHRAPVHVSFNALDWR